MRNPFNQIFGRNGSILNGVIALAVIAMIGLGCFCNKDKFDFGNNNSKETPTPSATPSPSATKEYKKADASKYEIPSDDELQDIVKKTMLDFNDALLKEDFEDFHDSISKYWARQTTPDKLKAGFQNLIDGDADMSEIKSMKAEFTKDASIEREGSLRKLMTEGEYDTKDIKTKFELQYIPEGKQWKLFGIKVYTKVTRKS
jgi:hypothetical protein